MPSSANTQSSELSPDTFHPLAVGSWTRYPSIRSFLDLPRSLRPPIWREFFAHRDAQAAAPAPTSDERPVLLIPGFMSGDSTLSVLADWLRDAGWSVELSHHTNSACSEVMTDRMVTRLETIAETSQAKTVIIGHSRGGLLAKVLAVRRPDLVDSVITLASPVLDPFGMHLAVRVLAYGSSLLTRLGVPNLVKECPVGDCCQTFHDDLFAAAKVSMTSVYSRSDGIVYWPACVAPGADCVEVDATHGGIVTNRDALAAIARSLRRGPSHAEPRSSGADPLDDDQQ